MNHHAKQLAATLMLGMFDLLEQAPNGAAVVCGGVQMIKSVDWTPELIAKNRATLQAVIDSPVPADEVVVWHDRIPRKGA